MSEEPTKGSEYLQYGGQAVIEGVMMRSPRYWSLACRAPNGQIVVETESVEKSWFGKQKWFRIPFVRGAFAMIDAMRLGITAMKKASNVQLDPRYQLDPEAMTPEQRAAWEKEQKIGQMDKKKQEALIAVTMVGALAFGFFLFQFLPNVIAEQLRFAGVRQGATINFATEMVKIVFFFGYILLIAQMKEIQEVFKYHGAEHKAINALEAGQELTPENCQAQTRLHPRCGTSFIVFVLLVSIIISTATPRYLFTGGQQTNFLVDVLLRFLVELVVLTPIIAGISYELIRFAGKFRSPFLQNTLFKPGLMSQLITTKEPNDGQVEVALAALHAVVEAEEKGSVEQPYLVLGEPIEAPKPEPVPA